MSNIDKIREILKEEANPQVNIDEMSLTDSWDDAGIDSLDKSSIFLALEEGFGVSFEDEEIDSVDTIQQVDDLIASKL
ncbi:acyl carrier protein [Ekhidna sp.]|uniref:acyl carrier protein n=1 Tax=Ekhidna sp. TaxID=2608089 RepID=UPI003C7D7CA8